MATYGRTPKTKNQAKKYALELEEIHGVKYVPIRRVNPIKSIFAINFCAVEEKELEEYLPEWEEIK